MSVVNNHSKVTPNNQLKLPPPGWLLSGWGSARGIAPSPLRVKDAAVPQVASSPLPPPKAEAIKIDDDAEKRLTPGSVSFLIIETLKEAKRPLPLRILLNLIRQKGKTELGYRALSSVISQCLARELVQRVGPGLYAYSGGEKANDPNTPLN